MIDEKYGQIMACKLCGVKRARELDNLRMIFVFKICGIKGQNCILPFCLRTY